MTMVPVSGAVIDGVLLASLGELAPTEFDPLSWVKLLGDALSKRTQQARIFDDYYRGEHRLPAAPTAAAHLAYRRLLRESRSNWAELIVDAVNERLRVIGFRCSAPRVPTLKFGRISGS